MPIKFSPRLRKKEVMSRITESRADIFYLVTIMEWSYAFPRLDYNLKLEVFDGKGLIGKNQIEGIHFMKINWKKPSTFQLPSHNQMATPIILQEKIEQLFNTM